MAEGITGIARKPRQTNSVRLRSGFGPADKPGMNLKHTMTSPVFHRVLAVLGLGSAFLIMASVFSPERMMAQNTPPSRRPASVVESTDPHEGLQSLGSIESATHVVKIFSTEGGPRYSIYTVDDVELGVLMSAEQANRFFPELQLPETDFSVPVDGDDEATGPLMIMDQLPIVANW